MTSIDLTDSEKNIFLNWLEQREKIICEELELLKNIRYKLDGRKESAKIEDLKPSVEDKQKKISQKEEDNSASWVNAVKKELQHYSRPVQSGEIVKRLLQKPSLAEKGKRFVTKAVTSKLWLLQERGEVSKTRENGRYVYSLKK